MSKKKKIIVLSSLLAIFILGLLGIGWGYYTGRINLFAGVISGQSRGAALSKGATQPSKTWYFAEGTTRTQGSNTQGNNFDTYLLLQNPGSTKAKVKVTFAFAEGQGSNKVEEYEVNPTSRYTIYAESFTGADKDIAMKVESDQPIVAERAMYFIYNGKNGSSSNVGSPKLSNQWTFAEGTTYGGFNEYILVYNPNDEDIVITAAFARSDQIDKKDVTIKAGTRNNIMVNDVLGGYQGDVAIVLQSKAGKGFVAERAMYFASGDKSGGSSSLGLTSDDASNANYMAESYVTSSGSFDEWVAVFNPQDKTEDVSLFAILDGQEIKLDTKKVPSYARATFHVNDYKDKGIIDKPSLSLAVVSNAAVFAERSIYINGTLGSNVYIHDGTSEKGTPQEKLSKIWYLPEGYTSNQNNRDFLEYLVIQNPFDGKANCTIKFMQNDGKEIEKKLTVPGKSRKELVVNDILTGEHSIEVASDQAVVTERVIYHNTIIPPQIASIEPASGYSGTGITISGSSFLDIESVLLNDQPIDYNLVDSNTITSSISGNPGSYEVRVKTKRGISDVSIFTIKAKPISSSRNRNSSSDSNSNTSPWCGCQGDPLVDSAGCCPDHYICSNGSCVLEGKNSSNQNSAYCEFYRVSYYKYLNLRNEEAATLDSLRASLLIAPNSQLIQDLYNKHWNLYVEYKEKAATSLKFLWANHCL